MKNETALSNTELELTQKIQIHFPRGEIPPDVIGAWNGAPKAVIRKKLVDAFGRMPIMSPDRKPKARSATGVGYLLAQSIVGFDFITPEEIMKACPKVVYSEEQVETLATTIPPVEVLRWCHKEWYVLMPAPPAAMSMLDVRKIHTAHFYFPNSWYINKEFAREDKTLPGWLMIKKTLVSNSTSKTWTEQNKLLSKFERVPNAAEMCWFIATYLEVREVRLFVTFAGRTSSIDSNHYVSVGHFGDRGFVVDSCLNYFVSEDLGLSAGNKHRVLIHRGT